ncbi:MAG: response regulator, partial [Clostridia bacterium]|nr:response regulator [Clostridia bacterium]
VESEQGKGTEFIAEFTFETTTPDKVDDTPTSSAEKETVPDLKNLRVLVVEDNFINIEIATMILKNEGFEVDIAENGKIALDTIEQADADKYDLVLMDIQMPVMNGYEATRAIRALPAPKGDIPIIAMSANAFEEDVREALSAGMNAHVTKPIDVKVLTETIRKTLYPHT